MKRVFAVISLVVALATGPGLAQAADAPASVPGFRYVRTVGSISEYTLESNGLTVLLMPERSAPVVTFMVTYMVGSRNDVTGTTGSTHLLEHLIFKGSKKLPGAEQISQERTGCAISGCARRTASSR